MYKGTEDAKKKRRAVRQNERDLMTSTRRRKVLCTQQEPLLVHLTSSVNYIPVLDEANGKVILQ